MHCLKFTWQSGFPSETMEEWYRKLTMLLNDKSKQELFSREKKDRRDFDEIAVLATRMGLYRCVFFCNAFESEVFSCLVFIVSIQLHLFMAAICIPRLLSSVRCHFPTIDMIWMKGGPRGKYVFCSLICYLLSHFLWF